MTRWSRAPAWYGARRSALRIAFGCTAGALVLGAGAGTGRSTRDAPPPAHTGGFGEPTCQACHFDADVNTGAGRMTIDGVPERFQPGGVYALRVTVTQPRLQVGGFELSARYEDGTQAGSLMPAAAERERLEVSTLAGVHYVHHVLAGIERVAPDTARWSVVWTAPAAAGTVLFHAAANAGNDDSSPFGDFIYTTTLQSSPGK